MSQNFSSCGMERLNHVNFFQAKTKLISCCTWIFALVSIAWNRVGPTN